MKNTIASILITGYVWLVLILTIVPFFLIYLLIWVITLPFDRKRIQCHYYAARWSGFYIRINPWWKVTLENRHKIDPGRAYLILSNHQSILDALIFYQLYFPFRWIAKKELLRVPIVGWVLYLNDHIAVIRGDKLSKADMVDRAVRSLREGISILIFPEGTRSHDGNIGTFREGAFNIALESKVPILPVIIDGTWDALPKNRFLFRKKQHIVVRILDAVNPEEYTLMNLPQILGKMERLMTDELTKLRNEKLLLSDE